MKPFTINRNSWHYKLNKNFFNEDEHWMESAWEPRHNNFCSYWRATVFRMIFASVIVAVVGFVVTMLLYLVYLEPFVVMRSVGVLIAVLGFCAIIALFSVNIANRKPSQSLFAQKYRANKEKICPMVEYK